MQDFQSYLQDAATSSTTDERLSLRGCPEDLAQSYCLNGAKCFAVQISEAIVYNCWCSKGFHGARCDYKYTDRTQPSNSSETQVQDVDSQQDPTSVAALSFGIPVWPPPPAAARAVDASLVKLADNASSAIRHQQVARLQLPYIYNADALRYSHSIVHLSVYFLCGLLLTLAIMLFVR